MHDWKPRRARPEDREAVVALGAAPVPADFDLFVTGGITGFLVLQPQLIRGLTGDRDSVVHQVVAPDVRELKSLLECALEAARGHATQFLTIEVAVSDQPLRELVRSLDFHLESHKISVASADCRPPEGSPYAVRLATPDDHYLMAILHSTTLEHTLCPGRDYDLSEATMQSMGGIFAQAARPEPESVALVLTRVSPPRGDGRGGSSTEELVGHLLLELTDTTGYIYDLAIAQEHWGGTAVRHLMRAGSCLLFQRGVPLFVGDVSASNRRALLFAQRALGFRVVSERYGRRLEVPRD